MHMNTVSDRITTTALIFDKPQQNNLQTGYQHTSPTLQIRSYFARPQAVQMPNRGHTNVLNRALRTTTFKVAFALHAASNDASSFRFRTRHSASVCETAV